MSKIIAVVNQKGGVGKTTTTLNVGAGLAKNGKKVLLVDLDPQGNLSTYLGYTHDGKPTISELIYQEVSGVGDPNGAYIRHSTTEHLDYIPASKVLAGMISIIGEDSSSQEVLRRILRRAPYDQYDYVLLDCKPSLDLLVCNALTTCTHLLIPVQPEPFSYNAVADVMDTCNKIKRSINPELQIAGIILTMYRKNTILSQEVCAALCDSYPQFVFDSKISDLTEAGRSTFFRRSLVNDATSRIGEEYLSAVNELLSRLEG